MRGHPAVGVLPFACIGGDASLRAFAAGAAHDVAAALGRVRSLVVIPYPLAGTVPHAASCLGVRYVVEGAIRSAGRQVRASVRLIKVRNGALLWAESLDGTVEDHFALMDRLSARVAATVPPRLVAAEIERLQGEVSGPSCSYDLLLAALAQGATRSRTAMQQAIGLLRQAVSRDPGYALAYAHLASVQWLAVAQLWYDAHDPAVSDLLGHAHKALALAGDDPEVLLLVSPPLATRGADLDGALATVYRALAANPHSAAALRMLGVFHSYVGEVDVALDALASADRLNPFDHGVVNNLGYLIGKFSIGDHESVVRVSNRLIALQPHLSPTLRWRAASLGLMGRFEEGKAVVRQIQEQAPGFSILSSRRFNEQVQNNLMRLPHVRKAFHEGLRLAGAPEN